MSKHTYPPELLKRAEALINICKTIEIPYEAEQFGLISWSLEMQSDIEMIETGLHKYSPPAVQYMLDMIEVRIKCFRQMRRKNVWVSPMALSYINNQITQIICAPIIPSKLGDVTKSESDNHGKYWEK